SQMALFAVIEVVERVGAGTSPVPFLHSAQLGVGLALQVVAAAAAVFVLSLVERAARRIADLLRPPRPAAIKPTSWALPADDVVEAWWTAPTAPRGPPLLAHT